MFLLDNNWWGESADNGIKLDLGERVIKPLKDEGGEIALNDRTPNALCVGATGAGKSVLINHILSGLIPIIRPAHCPWFWLTSRMWSSSASQTDLRA